MNHPSNKKLQLIASLSNDLATELRRICPAETGNLELMISNHGDFNVTLQNEQDLQGFFAPTHHQIAESFCHLLPSGSAWPSRN